MEELVHGKMVVARSWNGRKDRTHWVGWYRVQLARAGLELSS